jgi:hypothetical protein
VHPIITNEALVTYIVTITSVVKEVAPPDLVFVCLMLQITFADKSDLNSLINHSDLHIPLFPLQLMPFH